MSSVLMRRAGGGWGLEVVVYVDGEAVTWTSSRSGVKERPSESLKLFSRGISR